MQPLNRVGSASAFLLEARATIEFELIVGKLEADSMEVLAALQRIAVAGEGDSSLLCHSQN